MGGYSYQYFQYQRLQAENSDFPSDVLTFNNLGQGDFQRAIAGRLGMLSEKK
jgi:hypothetical protein